MKTQYDYKIVKYFTLASVFWAIFGMSMGVFIAFQLVYPDMDFGMEYFTFGRMRPVHTTGVIFAFAGNILIATSLFILQKTCDARLSHPRLARFIFIVYQCSLLFALIGYMFGITESKEYAEPEWYIDILIAIAWISYLYLYLSTLSKRKEKHIYVANWFYLAFIIIVAILHVGENLSIPISWTKSVAVFSGTQSAMVQWWYGHNAVGFLLTAGFLGMMYYFVPKRVGKPVYSYRLSILHFWGFLFLYIWAGAHHLHYTALPDWVQSLGMTMSIMLWVPSWGGMINGIMTISGSWYKLRQDPVLRFFVIALAFYGMSTFEGPVLAIKSVNALSHYTEWTISHVHSGTLGWVSMISFGALYHMVPVLWGKRDIYSVQLINAHLWFASVGIVLYITSMWAAGIMQGLMWRSYDDMGFLRYAFIEIVSLLQPYYMTRAIGGSLFLVGALIMMYNIYKTICSNDDANKRNESEEDEALSCRIDN
ncbi:MAG: cytochrome-c oxidase, cbb3-type subunit I [Proteobacteria bacterium]|nr:cytochrome-c oxidase, cbb3-type subunit I [Pseudomonadota bacterium]